MSAKLKRILVLCPGNAISGGPEALHQLVHHLREMKKDAAICYLPSGGIYETPEPYRHYDVPQRGWSDKRDEVVVVPETGTPYLRIIKKATPYVWWLSVDNYFYEHRLSWKKYPIDWILSLILGGRKTIKSMRHIVHLAQSEYAVQFLNRYGINSLLLTDYLASQHLTERTAFEPRQNIVAYNPQKGKRVNNLLRASLPDIDFFPIEKMNNDEVVRLLSSAKVYMDFGDHPGKDRIPREAAMAGCCVITGRRGSASNSNDVRIPETYKLSDTPAELPLSFRALVTSIFTKFDQHRLDFEGYRASIREEQRNFREQVHHIFGGM